MLDCPVCGGTFDDPKGRLEGGARIRLRTCPTCGTTARTSEPLYCPNCGSEECVYSGTTQDMGCVITRYRQCSRCVHTYRTYEAVEEYQKGRKPRRKAVKEAKNGNVSAQG